MKSASLLLAFAVALSGCGTRDYKDRPTEPREKNAEAPAPTRSDANTKNPAGNTGVPRLFQSYAKEGMFWKWTADEPLVQKIKCEVRDGSQVNYWSAFGYQMFGGAVLGIIYKASGGYWLGRPKGEPDAFHGVPVPTPPSPAWAWERIYLDSARLKAGALRGMFWTGLCANVLGPGYLMPTDGVFGTEYRALSSSIALGIAAAVAAKPYMNYFARGGLGGGTDGNDEATSFTSHVVRTLSSRLSYAGKKSFVGRTLAPNIVVIGIGAGVALLVNRSLQHQDANTPVPETSPDCVTPAATQPPTNGPTK